MNKAEFQKLAETRLAEAEVLLNSCAYSGAYYLAGYVIECALKACIAKKTKKFDFPPAPAVIRDIYVHDIEKLVRAAGLQLALDEEVGSNKQFEVNWGLVKDWRETSRYGQHSEAEAYDLYTAIADKNYGVLQWLKRLW